MLDEPTNHLDIHSCELLVEALNKYQGTFILVSHDRYFISKTANKIWEIVDHGIKEFKGGYDEWVAWNERIAKNVPAVEKHEATKEIVQKKEDPKPGITTPTPKNTPINKELKKELQRQQKQFAQVEEDLNKCNAEIKQLEADLADGAIYADKEKFKATEKAYTSALENRKKLDARYENIFAKLIELEEQQSS